MKKVLILAYDFPPYVSVGGLRPYAWYKHLKEFDIEPIVITRQWDNKYGNFLDYINTGSSTETLIEENKFGTIYRTAYNPNFSNRLLLKYGENKFIFVRKLMTAWYETMQFFFPIGTKYNLYAEADLYLKHNKVDVIIATGDPYILFKYAHKLSKKHNSPWIADYRDLWSQKKEIESNYFLNKLLRFLEKKTVKTATYITTVSTFLKQKISSLHPTIKYGILPNGYESEYIENNENIMSNKKCLTIAFAGSIYSWHPIDIFLKEVANVIAQNSHVNITINFYGVNNYNQLIKPDFNHYIKNNYPTLINQIEVYPKMQNHALLSELAKAHVMLLFNDYAFLGTKIYDYIGIKRTILFCFSNDSDANELKKKYYEIQEIEGLNSSLQEDLINETKAGIIVKDSEHLQQVLFQLHKEFSQNGFIKCNTINAEQYSRKQQVKQLADLIKQNF